MHEADGLVRYIFKIEKRGVTKMMSIIVGALIFGVGVFLGAGLVLAVKQR